MINRNAILYVSFHTEPQPISAGRKAASCGEERKFGFLKSHLYYNKYRTFNILSILRILLTTVVVNTLYEYIYSIFYLQVVIN